MKKNLNAGAQGGFTLIELIVVIVILGILAATALPKFVNLGGDARLASVNAAKGALSATSSMVHGKALIGNSTADIDVEGSTVKLTNGYPTADTGFAAAAGLSSNDYTIDTSVANKLTVSPKSAANTSCSVTYAQAASTTAAPVITLNATAANCN